MDYPVYGVLFLGFITINIMAAFVRKKDRECR